MSDDCRLLRWKIEWYLMIFGTVHPAAWARYKAAPGTNFQKARDKRWLLDDLRARLELAAQRLPRKRGFMEQVTYEGIDRFERLIKMVSEIPE